MNNLHNNPPEPIDAFRDRLALYAKTASELPAITEETAGAWKDHIGLGKTIAKDIEAEHARLKRPILDEGKKIDNAYKPLAAEATDAASALNVKLTKWVVDRQREAEKVAREKAEAARKAEEEAARAQIEPEEDPFLAAMATPAADVMLAKTEARDAQAAAADARRVESAGGGFRASGLATVRKAQVNDYPALAAYYAAKGNVDLKACLDKLAAADVRHAKGAPIDLPGVTVVEDQVLR